MGLFSRGLRMQKLAGYTIGIKIFESDRSVIFRTKIVADQPQVILKLLKNRFPEPKEIENFQREFEITQRVGFEGTIRTYGIKKHKNSLVLILEDIGGESLDRVIPKNGFSLEAWFKLSIKLCKILEHIHSIQLIHNAINPANIIVNKNLKQIKISDFGSSIWLKESASKADRLELSYLPYISPEQTGRTSRAIDFRSDYYSLGITLYESLTGTLPFHAKEPLEWIHCHNAKNPIPPHIYDNKIPKPVSDILMRLLAKSSDERYQSTFSLVEDLEQCRLKIKKDGTIEPFEIAQLDSVNRFEISQRFYGRKNEIKKLVQSVNSLYRPRSESKKKKRQEARIDIHSWPIGSG